MKNSISIIVIILRWVARITGALMIALFLMLFISGAWGAIMSGTNTNPISSFDILQLSLMGLFMIGLGMAWKWELLGSVIALSSFAIHCSIHPSVASSPIIFGVVAGVLFLLVWLMDRRLTKSEIE